MAERESERLARAVQAARERLRVTQEEFAELADLSLTTIQRVEQARITPRTKTFSGLDQGAGWVRGSARAVFRDGREPVLDEEDEPQDEPLTDEQQALWDVYEHVYIPRYGPDEAQRRLEADVAAAIERRRRHAG